MMIVADNASSPELVSGVASLNPMT